MTYRNILREIAYDNFGYFTTHDAMAAGVPSKELPKLRARGGIENIGYGLYRVTDIPISEEDQFMEATLLAGKGAYLVGESVLALLGFGAVNPRQIRVGTSRRVRRSLPAYISIVQRSNNARVISYRGVSSQQLGDAIVECRGRVPISRLKEASNRAKAEGFLSLAEWNQVNNELGE